jgi:3-methylfumaryl-CoA hydratase
MADGNNPAVAITHLRSWIGREDVETDILNEDLARKYHATFDLAGETPRFGEVVPRLIHFCLAQPAMPTAKLGPDGHPVRGGFLPPVPLPRRMWAGGSLSFHGDLRVGDKVRRVSRIDDVEMKQGSTGAQCFVTVRHWIEGNGQLAVEERQDLVYRELSASGREGKPPVAEQGAQQRPMKAEPPLLFRYSALTFNSHRIHYDRRYTTEVEGYPDLVVHGPMQAALLCNYATELRSAPPTRFSFRGFSPLFNEDTFVLHATEDGDRLKLWTARKGGPICMTAEAIWT